MTKNPPLLYYRTIEQMGQYRSLPVLQKIRQMEMQMEFMHLAMPEKAKVIRQRLLQKNSY